jgi:transcriptional regulator with XRE-family HTH domain
MGWTQKQMAKALSISRENYKKYETRTPLPHRYIEQFCIITGVSADELFNLELPVAQLPIRRS